MGGCAERCGLPEFLYYLCKYMANHSLNTPVISSSSHPLLRSLRAEGAAAVAVAQVGSVEERVRERYLRWLAAGDNAGMEYMRNWLDLRFDPRLLLEGARSVICVAFPYPDHPGIIASYALGSDYHDVLRQRLCRAVEGLRECFGGEYRICVDSAPVLERYWAERSGLGRRGRNGLIYVPGLGSRVFLAEIFTTVEGTTVEHHTVEFSSEELTYDPAGSLSQCRGNRECVKEMLCPPQCRRCIDACPAGALREDGTVRASRCLSYLTIEHRGDWDEEGREAMQTPAGRHTLYGCDICQRVCPLNIPAKRTGEALLAADFSLRSESNTAASLFLPEFSPRPEIASLTPEKALSLTDDEFSRLFKGSPIKRAKAAGLRRNARSMLD